MNATYRRDVFLAGAPIPAEHVRVLATLVKPPELAARLVRGVERDSIVIRLDDHERAAILAALERPPRELESFRAALAALPPDSRPQAPPAASDNAA